MLKPLIQELTGKQQASGRKKGRKRSRKRSRSGVRPGVQSRGSNNPLTREGIRGPVGQTLSRTQFTATSPLNLFNVKSGSTPGGIRVRGREMLGSVLLTSTSTGAWQLATINSGTNVPLNPTAFPRLFAYSSIYEMYIFHSATFILQSNQPTTATGEWLACIDYDSKDVVPTSSINQMRNISSTMANVYSDMSLVCLKSLSRLPKYNISESSSSDTDQVIQANFYLGIEGYTGTAGAAIGYLIVEYDVEFFTPQ